jgi:Ca2+/H+ antiporter
MLCALIRCKIQALVCLIVTKPGAGWVLIAALILTPEGISAIQAAQVNQLQRAVNICLGSLLPLSE